MESTDIGLFPKVKDFIKLKGELESYLSKHPEEWPKFQQIFDSIVNQVSYEIQRIEIDNKNDELKIYKLKKLFEKEYRHYFLYGEYTRWAFEKPFGYPGDFKIIDEIYQNQPKTTGLERLYDNHFMQLAAAKATRERKIDFKKFIFNFIKEHRNKNIRIMNLASGPAREIKELLSIDSDNVFSNTIFDCYDFEAKAIEYAKQLLGSVNNINFFQKNIILLAFKKDIREEISVDYDLIYSTGLFDYLDERIVVKLVNNLRKLLKKDGIMIISNYRDKFSNPSAGLMEWIAEWNLIYRTEDEFKKIFLEAGFSQKDLQIIPQNSKVMQYCFANMR